ncbi:TPA: hypothetical protein DDZ75_01165, partial [Patescibacteria group bacterium]|nr:hypothetical protein [Patescibacteria group bacterium]
MSVDYGASTTITTSVQSGALSLTAGATSTILVSALEIGKTGKTYLVNVYRNNVAQATPTFSPVAGALSFGDTVTITSAGADRIHYTTNGIDPTTSDPSVVSGGTVTISSAVTLKALAVKSGSDNSVVGSAAYTQSQSANLSSLALSDVTLSPSFAGGTYTYTSTAVANAISTTKVTATGAGVLQMSINGGASTTISSGVQSGTLSLTAGATSTVLVSLTETGKATTTYAVGVYRNYAQLTTPTFTPNSGAIALGVTTIQIDSDVGSTIYYTTDGSTPDTGDLSISTGATIALSSVANPIKAIAVKSGYENSSVGTSGTYTQSQSANLSSLALSDVTLSPTFAGGTYT